MDEQRRNKWMDFLTQTISQDHEGAKKTFHEITVPQSQEVLKKIRNNPPTDDKK